MGNHQLSLRRVCVKFLRVTVGRLVFAASREPLTSFQACGCLRQQKNGHRRPIRGSNLPETGQTSVAVQVFGDVAGPYWIAIAEGKDKGQEVAYRGRITDTWMEPGDTWVIIGGMSAPSPE